MSRETRATTVVSQPARFSPASVSARESRSQASCTASSASLLEPSIRYATDSRCWGWRSNSSVCQSLRVTSHLRVRIRHLPDERNAAVVTARRERHERNRSDQAGQDLPRRRGGGEEHRLRGRRGRSVRTARPERCREVDHGRDADDDDHADRRQCTARRLRRCGGATVSAPYEQRRLPGAGDRQVADRPAESRDPRPPLGRRAARGRSTHGRARRHARPDRARRPARRHPQRWRTPPARDRPRARLAAAGALPRRADGRPRPAHPAELLEVIASLRNRTEMTVLLTTHYLGEAERLCDRVAVIHAGRIVALDSPRSLLAALGRELVELRVDGSVASALDALREHGIAGEDAFAVGPRLTLPLHDASSQEAIAAIHELGLGGAISAREPTLDDVYLRLTGDSLAAAA